MYIWSVISLIHDESNYFAKILWGYALETAARILNMVPTKKVDTVSYEIWHGNTTKFSYLRVWGCKALVKRDTPNKLDSGSIKCIFVVVPADSLNSIPADYVSAGHVLVPADNDTFMPNPSASPSFTQDDTFMPEPIQPMPTFTQTAFSQPAVHIKHNLLHIPTQLVSSNLIMSSHNSFHQFPISQSCQHAKFHYLEKETRGTAQKRWEYDAKRKYNVHPPVLLMNMLLYKGKISSLQNFSVTEVEGLHRVMTDFRESESVDQVLARQTMIDINLKLSKSTSFSWSLDLDVRIGHSFGEKVALLPTHSAFIGTACSGQRPYLFCQLRIECNVKDSVIRLDHADRNTTGAVRRHKKENKKNGKLSLKRH
ncbi:hypothetical protein Tco_0238074 [Tanacetum coccineum]